MNSLPSHFTERPQWLVWKYVSKPGQPKPTKVPHVARAKGMAKASSTDASTWGTYGAAQAVAELPEYDGIGYVLTPDDGLVFIDLDGCRDAGTGVLEAWAQEIIQAVDSYTELSPSGTGVHIFAYGSIPGNIGRKRGGVEMYSTGRYATMTGQHLVPTPDTILDRTGEIAALYATIYAEPEVSNAPSAPSTSQNTSLTDQDIIRIASQARNSTKFLRLWGGDTGGYPSRSEADLALCSILAFYTQDPGQLDRLMGESGLKDNRWSQRVDYRRRTLEKALRGAGVHFGDDRVGHVAAPTSTNGTRPPITEDELPIAPSGGIPGLVRLSDVEPEQVEWLWPGRIPLGKLTILDGDPGLGKSMITCDIAARVSSGREMPDGTFGDMDGPAGVVLLSAEDGLADTVRPRLDAAGADCTRIAALTHVVEKETGLMKTPSVADLHEIEVAIAATGAKLVIIDPVVAYLPEKTKSHNDQDVRRVLAPLAELAERNHVAVWLLRHLNKAPGGNPLYRGGGSIAFIGAVRSGLLAAQDPEDDTGERRIIAGTKCNLARAAQALAYHVETADNGAARIVWEGFSGQTAATLLTQVDPEEKSQLAEAVEFLRDLLQDGEVRSTDVQTRAKAATVAFSTLKRAKNRLGVKAERRGAVTDAYWVWVMPQKEDEYQEDHQNP